MPRKNKSQKNKVKVLKTKKKNFVEIKQGTTGKVKAIFSKKLVYYPIAISFLLLMLYLAFQYGSPILTPKDTIQLASLAISAGSILFSFFMIAITSKEIQLGRFLAFAIWIALVLIFVAAFGGYWRYLGYNFILSQLISGSLLFGLGILLVIVVFWFLWRSYYE